MRARSKVMKSLIFGLLILACSVSPCRAAGLQLSIQDGKVSIDAQDVTVRQILTEWARIGKTRIVNIERLSGGPITLKLDAMPEKQALEIVLRTDSGLHRRTSRRGRRQRVDVRHDPDHGHDNAGRRAAPARSRRGRTPGAAQ